MKQPGVEHAVAFPGLSINGFTNSSNSGIVFATLKPFSERKRADQSGAAIAQQLNQKFAAVDEAFVVMFPPPPVQGLGTTGGFKLQLQDRGSLGYEALDTATKDMRTRPRGGDQDGLMSMILRWMAPDGAATSTAVAAKANGRATTAVARAYR